MGNIKVLIVDDQPILREGLKSLLATCEDIDVIAEAGNGKEAIEQLNHVTPDVILMDIRMPVLNGVEATKQIKEKYPSVIIIILTTFDDDQYILDALRYGASGYLLKDMGIQQLAAAIRDGVSGNVLLPGRIANKLTMMINPPSNAQIDFSEYSTREKDIIQLLVKGYSNVEIAETLYLSIGTVKNYVSQIYAKANVSDRSNAVIYFKQMGF
ncbi:MAG: DNA-binding response regulator [Firmicutes bacterium HGW-Firmicutes-20]|jgi:DNA-binding NarL/FixJ family response regulator|nr:MAG: DNA-binding response regulator [Firmicutes bacterium HGW-Firmicutes-20]PKM90150.1 MAG: DNA-binding response regulator [Firmicutes bacterium HGW-Firmicutes-10]